MYIIHGKNSEAGSLGVKMIDETVNFFLNQKIISKPNVVFYKIFGLSTIFPKSKIWNLPPKFLDEEEIHEVDVYQEHFFY